MKKQYVCILDNDGHFGITDLKKRDVIREFICERLEENDHWLEELENYNEEYKYEDLTEAEWLDFIYNFVTRGILEIVEKE